jgi:hypothetical protein
MGSEDDTPQRTWGPGFKRGYELALARAADALRRRLLADDFTSAGWRIGHVEAFIAAIVEDAEKVGPTR